MRTWAFVLALIAIFACAGLAYAGSTGGPTYPVRDVGRSIQIAIVGAWSFLGAVGDTVTQVGETAPQVLGVLTCLLLPLAWLGAWTMSNLGRILGLMALRDNVRSFFHE
jgi:hypothetical protein